MDKKVQRLILKKDDILVIKIPERYYRHRSYVIKFYENLRKKLLPRKNKVLLLSDEFDVSVIGKNEIKEYVSNIDLWNLFDDDEELNGENIENV